MTTSGAIENRPVVVDTGPLLCFGHIAGGVTMLARRYCPRLRWTTAVAKEVAECARRSDAIARAANNWLGRNKSKLGEAVVVSDRREVHRMHAEVQAQSVRLRPNRVPQPGKDWGEAESLVLAVQTGGWLLSNDRAARSTARLKRIDVYNAVDVLIAEVRENRLELRKAKAMYDQLRSADIDGGVILPDRFTADVAQKWKSPAPV